MSRPFDAFISYRQVLPDRELAVQLHRLLETWTIPPELAASTDRRSLRVFLDREELRAGPLTAAISEALAASRTLFVICSPRAVESTWINDEIALFLRTHSVDKVVQVVIDGSPNEVVPSALAAAIAAAPDRPRVVDLTVHGAGGAKAMLRRARLDLYASALIADTAAVVKAHRRRIVRRTAFAAAATALLAGTSAAIRQSTAHLADRQTIVFARGLPALHPLLGSDRVIIDTGFDMALAEPSLRDRIRSRDWCFTLPFGPTRCTDVIQPRGPIARVLPNPSRHRTWAAVRTAVRNDLGSCGGAASSLPAALLLAERLHLEPRTIRARVERRLRCSPFGTFEMDARAVADRAEYRNVVIDVLRRHLRSQDREVVLHAANLLIGMGERTGVAAVVEPWLANDDKTVAVRAACTLLRVDPRREEAAAVIWAQPLFGFADVGWLPCLGEASPVDRTVVEQIVSALDHPEIERVRSALFYLRSLAVKDERLTAVLLQRLSDSRPQVRFIAAEKLLSSGDPRAATALLALVREAPDGEDPLAPMQEPVFVRAARLLLPTPLRASALATLRTRMEEESPGTVIAAARELKKAGVRSPGMTAGMIRIAAGAPREALPLVIGVAHDLPGDKQQLTSAVDRALAEIRASTNGPLDPAFFDLAAARLQLPPRATALERELRDLLDETALAAPAYAQAIASRGGHDLHRTLSLLLDELDTLQARRSSPYRKAIAEQIRLIGQSPAMRDAVVREVLARWVTAEWLHQRAEAHTLLNDVSRRSGSTSGADDGALRLQMR